jgi:lipopolysaccharide export system protein LptC
MAANNFSPTEPTLAPVPTGIRPAKPQQPWHWRLQQRAATFLPIVCMGILAASTWWLVKNSLQPTSSLTASIKKHEPDYEMRHFSVHRHKGDGKTVSQIEGQLLRHYPDTDTLEIDQARILSTSLDGTTTVATAHKAVAYNEGNEVELFGDAQVIRQANKTSTSPHNDALYLKSNYIRAMVQEERVISNQPVTIQHGTTLVQASGMDYTYGNGTIIFNGRSRASFTPATK